MRSSYKILNKDAAFFDTSTIVEWIPVFTTEKYFKIVTDTMKLSFVMRAQNRVCDRVRIYFNNIIFLVSAYSPAVIL
jgi:hypothetical protein